MDELQIVSRLEDLAFDASYNEIIGNLLYLCREHRPENKKLEMVTYSSFLSRIPFITSQNMIQLIRNQLGQNLLGLMGEKIRGKYAEKFYTNLMVCDMVYSCQHCKTRPSREEFLADIWAFFECVLDQDFMELKTHIAFPDSEPNPKLIPIIAERSPLLKKLTINFKLAKLLSHQESTVVDTLLSGIRSLSSLQHLTSLTLTGLEEKPTERTTILSLLGKSCPLLSFLSFSGLGVTDKDLLAIILGEAVFDLFPDTSSLQPVWCTDNAVLARLVVPKECLTSMCFTLQTLKLNWGQYPSLADKSKINISGSATAFALRHLPVLLKLDKMFPTCMAINILHDTDDTLLKFQMACLQSNHLLRVLGTTNYAGYFALTTLDSVSLLHGDLLRTVGLVCPFLKKVGFCLGTNLPCDALNNWYSTLKKDITSPDDVEAFLTGWPTLTAITLRGVKPEYVKPILKVFGPGLENLKAKFCSFFPMAYLLSCPKLRSLSILFGFSRDDMKEYERSNVNPVTFLPQLESFETNFCIGPWSTLIEQKSTLTRLILDCCHIGTGVYGSSQGPNDPSVNNELRSEWSAISSIWTNLEVLEINDCAGLTMELLSGILPQLPRLKEVHLPVEKILPQNERDLFYEVMDSLSSRVPPIKLIFEEFLCVNCCPFVEQEDLIDSEATQTDDSLSS